MPARIEVKYDPRQIEQVMVFLSGIPEKAKEIVTMAVAEWMVGNEYHGLAHAPYYKHVNRYAGFPGLGGFVDTSGYNVPPGYKSKKQHKYVMAAISNGEIVPGIDNRTGNFQNNWQITPEPYGARVTNFTPYGKYLMGSAQTIMHKKIGWRHWSDVLSTNIRGAMRHARSKLREWLQNK